jgi:hypothetical protein
MYERSMYLFGNESPCVFGTHCARGTTLSYVGCRMSHCRTIMRRHDLQYSKYRYTTVIPFFDGISFPPQKNEKNAG